MIHDREEAIRSIVSRYAEPPCPPPTVRRRGKPRATVDNSQLTDAEIDLRDRYYMSCAIELAREAERCGDVPVGALIVQGARIVSADFNGRESEHQALYHAECAAIYRACRELGGWRLPGCELFVTLEPCVMCAGAVMASRLPRVVIAADDPKAGAFGGTVDIDGIPTSHHPQIRRGIMSAEASELIRTFFESRRDNAGSI